MTLVPDGRSGTCKTTGAGPRTFCTCQIGPHPTPQIPPPGAIRPPPTQPDGIFFLTPALPRTSPVCLSLLGRVMRMPSGVCVCLISRHIRAR